MIMGYYKGSQLVRGDTFSRDIEIAPKEIVFGLEVAGIGAKELGPEMVDCKDK